LAAGTFIFSASSSSVSAFQAHLPFSTICSTALSKPQSGDHLSPQLAMFSGTTPWPPVISNLSP
jgi:hypothetical protein